MSSRDKLKIVRFALPSAAIAYLGNVVGVAYARQKGWQTDEGLLDVVAHANNFFDSVIASSATALAVDTIGSPRNLPMRKALAVGGIVLSVGLGLNTISETELAHQPPFSSVFNEETETDEYDFLYGAMASTAIAGATVNAVRRKDLD